MKSLEWSQHFSHYKLMGIFQDVQGQVTPQSLVGSDRIANSFVFVPCKNEGDSIINEGSRAATKLYVNVLDPEGR